MSSKFNIGERYNAAACTPNLSEEPLDQEVDHTLGCRVTNPFAEKEANKIFLSESRQVDSERGLG